MENESIQRDLVNPRLINLLDYRFLERLGQGSMGSVFRAHNAKLKIDVAIKILHSTTANDHIAQERFLRELKALAQLSHENIVKVHHSGVADTGELYYVMEFLDGITLASELENSKTLSSKRFFEIVPQIANGLAEIHAQKILHRDLKPGNIMLCKNVDGATTVKIIDFGLVRQAAADVSGTPTLTQENTNLGSPSYMSPEQCLGQRANYASDIFALGCIMYECIAGSPPQIGESDMETFHKRISEPPGKLQIASYNKKSEQLSKLIMRCLQQEPALRPQKAQEIVEQINAIFDKGAATPDLFRKDANKAIIVATIVIALSVISAGAILFYTFKSNRNGTDAVPHLTMKIGESRRVKEISTTLLNGYSDQINIEVNEIERKNKSSIHNFKAEETKLLEILASLDKLSEKPSTHNDVWQFGIVQLRLRILNFLHKETIAAEIEEEKKSLKYADSNPFAASWVRSEIANLYLRQNNPNEAKHWAEETIRHISDVPKMQYKDEIDAGWCHTGGGTSVEKLAYYTLGIADCRTGSFSDARRNFSLANASDSESDIGQLLRRQGNEAEAYFAAGAADDALAALRNCLQQVNERAPFEFAEDWYLELADSAKKFGCTSLARKTLGDGMSKYLSVPEVYAKLKNKLQMLK